MKVLQLNKIQPLSIPDHIALDLQYLAIVGYPYEVCGALYTHDIIVQYPNTFAGDRTCGFDMEVDVKDVGLKALWHSHPRGLDAPSTDDIPCMQLLAEHGFTFHHIIVTPKAVYEYEAVLVDAAVA